MSKPKLVVITITTIVNTKDKDSYEKYKINK